MFSKKVNRNLTAAYELKLEKGTSMPFNKVKEHQIIGLKQAKSGGLFHKFVDMPHFKGAGFRFDSTKPCDCVVINHAKAYVGICFYVPRKPKEVILIDIDDFVKEMETSKRKSLTKERAKEISESVLIV